MANSFAEHMEAILNSLIGLAAEQALDGIGQLGSQLATSPQAQSVIKKLGFMQKIPPHIRGRIARQVGELIADHGGNLKNVILDTIAPHLEDLTASLENRFDSFFSSISNTA